MKKINLITSTLLLSSTFAFGADSIDTAFKEGKVSGSLNLYTENYDHKTTTDSGFNSGDIELSYETGNFMGLSGKVGFVGAHEFSEKENGDADILASKALMSEANLTYAIDGASLTVGRQAVSLEWMGDYHEAAIATITAVQDTTIVLAYSDKVAVAGFDEMSEKFEKFNGKKGAYVVDVKYTGLAGIELNPYYYTLPDTADSYGLKATYSADMFGAVAHYATADVDGNSDDDSIVHIEGNASVAGLSFALGYIKTDKDAGADDIGAGDDNISPFEEGNYVYDVDAKTMYGSIGYEIVGINLGLLYGETKYGATDDKEKELNLMVDYSFTDSLSASALYADINAENSANDYNKFLASVTYSF